MEQKGISMILSYDIIKRKIKGEAKLTISGIKFIENRNKKRELTYWLHDYGRLAYWLRKYGHVDDNPVWSSLEDIYMFEDAIEPPLSKKRINWIKYHVKKLSEIRATREIEKGKFRLGDFGKAAFEASERFADWSKSLEALIITRLLSTRIENLGILLRSIYTKPIEVKCLKCPSTIIPPEDFRLSWGDISTSLRDAYLIHTELPMVIPEFRSPNSTTVLSGLLFNELYSTMSNIRERIVERLAKVGKTVNRYILTDRGSYEVKRGLERLNILHRKYGSWFITINDQLLSSLAMYALVRSGRNLISLEELTATMKHSFRFLVDPYDIGSFIKDSVESQTLGINLDVLWNNLEQNFLGFIERLVSLGFAIVRPDGEVSIETT